MDYQCRAGSVGPGRYCLPLLPGTLLVWAKRAGAGRLALHGAAVGAVAGIFMSFVGVLFMPLVGAAVGEDWAQRDQQRAAKIALATWFGPPLGIVAKVVMSFVMVGIFLVALWV